MRPCGSLTIQRFRLGTYCQRTIPEHVFDAFQDGLPEEGTIQARLRERAVPMLCAMAHSTQRGRAALGAADGAGVLLGLLRDPPYQVHQSRSQGHIALGV